jgi:hypothetical protein
MFDHELNPRKGWPSPYAVDHRIQADSAAEGILAGMVVHKDPTSGKAIRGLTALSSEMPLFVFQGQDEFDVNGDVGNIIGGWMNTLVAIGSYELQTTEFVSPATYNINDPLTSVVHAVSPTDKGKVQKTTLGSNDVICGIVSETGPVANDHGKEFVTFWPVFIPKR